MPASLYTSNSKPAKGGSRLQLIKFLKRSLILLAMIVALDQATGLVMHQLYFNAKSGKEYEINYAFTKVADDIIIIGSSKARRNYNTPLLADSMKMSCYNAGQDGQSLLFSYAMTQMILSHHKPKLIVVEMFPEELYYNEVHYDRLNVLLPYYADYPQVREVANWRGIRNTDTASAFYKLFPYNIEKIKLLSQAYRYNSMWFDLLKGIFIKQQIESGFFPLHNTLTEKEKQQYINKFEVMKRGERNRFIDPLKLKSLIRIINLCKENKLDVCMVMSPVLKRYNQDPVYILVNSLSKEMAVPLLDFTGDNRFNDIKYFADNHLNLTGATYFTSVLSSYLKNELSNKMKAK